jgi:homoserine dehydrogenase
MIPQRWLLAHVAGAKNALYVQSYALGSSMYYGAGAGMMPTAMACVSDLIEVCRNIQANAAGALPLRSYMRMHHQPVRDIGLLRSRYYLRFGVLDRPGALGQLATILGEHEVSIAQVVQEQPHQHNRPVTVVVVTHVARESNVRRALEQVAKLTSVVEPAALVRIAE